MRQFDFQQEPQDAISLRGYIEKHRAYAVELQTLSSTHITWFTHKNPYGCWICDMLYAYRTLIDSMQTYLYPSALLDKHDRRSSIEEESRVSDIE